MQVRMEESIFRPGKMAVKTSIRTRNGDHQIGDVMDQISRDRDF
jgi:hypothetical protein